MSNMSNYLAAALAGPVLGGKEFVPPEQMYVGLLLVEPELAIVEPIGGEYARQPIGFSKTIVSGSYISTAEVKFPVASAEWGPLTHFGIFDAARSGHLLYWGMLVDKKGEPTQRKVEAGERFRFLAGDITLKHRIVGRAA